MLPTRRLGRSDLQVSPLGFGAWQLGGHGWRDLSARAASDAVVAAADLGVNLFDTADVYGLGESERRLSLALGERRYNAIIASKGGLVVGPDGTTRRDASPRHLRAAIVASLARLRLDVIPLYQVHWPDGITPLEAILDELERCRAEGLLRWYGLSNFGPADVAVASAYPGFASLQLRFSMLDVRDAEPSLAACRATGTAVITHSSLAGGLLAGRRRPDNGFPEDDNRRRSAYFSEPGYSRHLVVAEAVDRVAAQYGVSAAEVAIRWTTDTPGVTTVLCGCRDAVQARANFRLDFRLPPDARALLDSACREAGLMSEPSA